MEKPSREALAWYHHLNNLQERVEGSWCTVYCCQFGKSGLFTHNRVCHNKIAAVSRITLMACVHSWFYWHFICPPFHQHRFHHASLCGVPQLLGKQRSFYWGRILVILHISVCIAIAIATLHYCAFLLSPLAHVALPCQR